MNALGSIYFFLPSFHSSIYPQCIRFFLGHIQPGSLTCSFALPMNFPFFHQVSVAGGHDPTLRHSRKDRPPPPPEEEEDDGEDDGGEAESGSEGRRIFTVRGRTGTGKKLIGQTGRVTFVLLRRYTIGLASCLRRRRRRE